MVRLRRMLADEVYDELVVALVDGRYQPDTPLNIDALARELDVSQTPVREALVRLEATGLVQRTALKGYRVSPMMTTEDWADLTEARLVLEPVNARLAAHRSKPEFLDRLTETLVEMKKMPQGTSFQDFRSFWEADEQFHKHIARQTGNRFLMSAYESLGGQIQRFRLFAGLGVVDAEHAVKEHSAILEALSLGDPQAAESAMHAHIFNVKQRVLDESRHRSL